MKVQSVLMASVIVILTYNGISLRKKKPIPCVSSIAPLTATSNAKLGLYDG
jgi:hypothetical protein